MKIAVWRYGAGFQTEMDSVVGGGRIASAVVDALAFAGHEVTIYGSISAASEHRVCWANQQTKGRVHVARKLTRLGQMDAVLVLTGPFNALYSALPETYERLASFEGPVAYAWWDAKLPFHFAPEAVKLFRAKSNVTQADILRNKRWTILTQLQPANLPAKAPASCVDWGRGLGVEYKRCFWELAEIVGEPLEPARLTEPHFGYFGSDRPGRIAELERWFAQPESPNLDLYGKWKPASLEKLLQQRTRYAGPVAEGDVREKLNGYRATLHSADMAYVKADFIAQRFMENAMAGVPVAYSDRIQTTVREVVGEEWMVRTVPELVAFLERCADREERARIARRHQELVLSWARSNPSAPAKVLQEVFR